MLTLPANVVALLAPFAPLFSRRVWRNAQVLLVGFILAPGKRTVTSALRAMGLSQEKHFQNFHRVLNRAQWSPLKAAGILLRLLVRTFVAEGTVLIGFDDTLERRRGDKIAAKGVYHDAVRSSKSFFVKSTGLRWIVMMLLVPVPFSGCIWALPFFVVLAPSERYHQERDETHRTLTDWARQMVFQVRRWLPDRSLVFVADQSYAALQLLHQCAALPNVTMVTRLRLDAALYDFPPTKRKPGQKGPMPKKGPRQPSLTSRLTGKATTWTSVTVANWYNEGPKTVEVASGTAIWHRPGVVLPIRWVLIRDPEGKFAPQALLCTDRDAAPEQIILWFIARWRLEVTFEESRAHLGVETQRQWSDLAIARTTPVLFGLFSLITVLAHQWMPLEASPVRQAAWYAKEQATFSDAIALVRRKLWPCAFFSMSPQQGDSGQSQQDIFDRFAELLCYAA